jgi:type IV secretion system protein TrbL
MIMNRTAFWWLLAALALAGGLLGIGNAYAQEVGPNNSLDAIVRLYRDHAHAWESTLLGFAKTLFWLLALIEFSFAAISLAFKGADFGDWVATMVNQILFIGFFYTLLLHSAEWAGDIVQSFRHAADAAAAAAGGSSRITPSNIFDLGLQLSSKVIETLSLWAPGDSIGLVISALIIIICFALIAAFLIVALVESYIVISAGVLLMGFGGSRWTKDYAVKIIVYAVSVGAKLFVLQLLVGMGEAMIREWVENFEANYPNIFLMVGSAIVMLAVTKIVPEMVQGLINGTSVSSGSSLTGAAAAVGGATVRAAAGVVGAGMAVGAAGQLASAQVAASTAAGAGPASSMARMAQLTGHTFKNLGSSATEDLGRRLSGRAHHGTTFGRMTASLQEHAKDLRAEANKPQPPPASPSSGESGNTIRPE